MKWQVLIIMTEQSLSLATLGQESVHINNQHNNMSWTVCYNDICQTHQSDKKDSEWYSKSLKKDLHETQVKRCVESLYSRSDSKESYEVIKLFSTKKKLSQNKLSYMQWGNHYFSDSSQENFSQEEL